MTVRITIHECTDHNIIERKLLGWNWWWLAVNLHQHGSTQWTDKDWLLLLAAAYQSDDPAIREAVKAGHHSCLPWERLRRLRAELDITVKEPPPVQCWHTEPGSPCAEHDVNEWACVAHPQTGEQTHFKRARPGLRVDFTGSSLHGARDPLETSKEQP